MRDYAWTIYILAVIARLYTKTHTLNVGGGGSSFSPLVYSATREFWSWPDSRRRPLTFAPTASTFIKWCPGAAASDMQWCICVAVMYMRWRLPYLTTRNLTMEKMLKVKPVPLQAQSSTKVPPSFKCWMRYLPCTKQIRPTKQKKMKWLKNSGSRMQSLTRHPWRQ